MTSTMLDDRGAEFVSKWPFAIARRIGISIEAMSVAIKEVTGGEIKPMALYEARESGTPLAEVGALTSEKAQEVIARLREMRAERAEHEKTHCHCCGLKLRGGECPAC